MLLGTTAADPGCDDAFEVMDQYVDAVLQPIEPGPGLTGFLSHLQHCAACREDTEGLLAVLGQPDGGKRLR
jgi:hypothetical protein